MQRLRRGRPCWYSMRRPASDVTEGLTFALRREFPSRGNYRGICCVVHSSLGLRGQPPRSCRLVYRARAHAAGDCTNVLPMATSITFYQRTRFLSSHPVHDFPLAIRVTVGVFRAARCGSLKQRCQDQDVIGEGRSARGARRQPAGHTVAFCHNLWARRGGQGSAGSGCMGRGARHKEQDPRFTGLSQRLRLQGRLKPLPHW